MSDAATHPAPGPQPRPLTAGRGGVPLRVLLLGGCSIGGTLCASLSAASDINLPFAIASAVFGAILVVITAAPATAAPAAAPPAAVNTDTPALAVTTRQQGSGTIGIGIAAAVLSFIVNQLVQFAVGFTAYGITGPDLTPEQMFALVNLIGLSVIMIRVPFDLLVGAYLVSRARNVFGALGMFALTYLGCYLVEQSISAAFGMSGLFMTATQGGLEALLYGFGWVLGLPILSMAVGAFGARGAALLMRSRR